MRGYLAVPDSGSGPGVLVIQEWWGLNPQMKGTADHLAENGFVALAPDLYRGELAGHDEMDKAGHLMSTLPAERAAADMSLAVDALRDHASTTGRTIGAIGFCMGGMLSLLVAALRGDAVEQQCRSTGIQPARSRTGPAFATVRGHFLRA